MTEPLPRKKRDPMGRAVARAGLLLALGVFLHLSLTQATHHFLFRGILSAVPGTLGVMAILLPAILVVALAVSWLDRRERLPGWLNTRLIRMVAIVLFAVAVASGAYRSQPKMRYTDRTGLIAAPLSDVRVAGYSRFPSSKWLFSFHVDSEDADLIVSMLALTRDPSVDLRKQLARDPDFPKADLSTGFDIPVSGNLECYSFETPANTKSGTWITFVVEKSKNRAWLYKSTWGLHDNYGS